MTDIELPIEKDRHGWYRFFEILPGTLSWTMLALPFILCLINVNIGAIFVLAYLLINFTRGLAGAIRSVHGFRTMKGQQKLPWRQMIGELEAGEITEQNAIRPKWHYDALLKTQLEPNRPKPSEVIHAIIIATVKETRETLEATIKSVTHSDYDMSRVLVVLAYEGRAGQETEDRANALIAEYRGEFMDAFAVKHPSDLPNEVIGKGGNVTYAGRELQKYLAEKQIDPERVVVTTLDADNRPDRQYLAAVTYIFSVCPDPLHASFQPVALFTNNIWDAPAPMRVLATGNSLFHLVTSLRQHALRNFSAHAQPMAALIETDFWSVRTVVEDGHHFWRSYFRFDGNYQVFPVHLPIYQDAVLAETYRKTVKAQFKQIARWSYGASDVAYVATMGFFRKNKVPKIDLLAKFMRLLEGHVTWAVGPVLVLAGGFIPALFSNKQPVVYLLPVVVSHIQTVALITAVITVFLALRTLPPRPARYRRHRTIWMVLQWGYLPFTTLIFNSLAALSSQTRLMFKLYMSKFDVTEKAVVTESGEKVTSGTEKL
ncbi:MAG TPA: glycosyltransferase family 2 protein [Candidatus Microsaccharimonas sp.]|nr:glycosyltransferase family 2 protein [Candidatus Microsaccharimonas sp.]